MLVRHGHFAFYPKHARDVSRFTNYFGDELVREGEYYTFENLKDAPRYSILGKPFLLTPAIKTFEGEPWDVMRENSFVYDITTGLIVPKLAITLLINPPLTGYYFTAQTPLIQPGSRNAKGRQLLSYDAEYIQDTLQLRVMEFQYE